MTSDLRSLLAVLCLMTLLGLPFEVGALPSPASPPGDFDRLLLPFLDQFCLQCHGQTVQKGGFRLDDLSRDFSNEADVSHWLEVVDRLSVGDMPPASAKLSLSSEKREEIVDWLAARIKDGEAERLANRDEISFHRLTRDEYANTIFDLLGVRFHPDDPPGLNEDEEWNGFSKIGSTLSLSPSHIEKYLAAGERILDEAYPDSSPTPFREKYSAVDLVGGPVVLGAKRYADLEQSGRVDEIRVDLWPGQSVRIQPSKHRVKFSGVYRFRIRASGVRSLDGFPPHLVVRDESLDRILFEQDLEAPEDDPIRIEFEAHLPAGRHEFTLTNGVVGPLILTRFGRTGTKPFFSLKEGRIPWQIPLKDDHDTPLYPLLILDELEWEGPVSTGTEGRAGAYHPTADADRDEIRTRLLHFSNRAFRRPVKPEEIDGSFEIFEKERSSGASLISAIKTAMLAILSSPNFLYLVEGSPTRVGLGLDAWELASRLSYFLWDTMPDEELRRLASSGELQDPRELRSQVDRMLKDPKADRFARSFPTQWLHLRDVGKFAPNLDLYPDYDRYLEKSMVEETLSFFGQVLKKNLSLREFLDSDWTMLNPRLARHYGISGLSGDLFRRFELKPNHHRGGVLTQASILSLTSDGTRHRPVHRGAWLSESIFGESPPPPPANIDPIDPIPVDGAKLTLRQQLDLHQSNPSCATCHRKIDPLGLAFDNYDAIGRWRTEEIVPTGIGSNPAVDPSGRLPDGRTFENPNEFKKLLLAEIEKFNLAFVEKLATYAIRRTIVAEDRQSLDEIAEASKQSDYRLRDLVTTLVLSDLFQRR